MTNLLLTLFHSFNSFIQFYNMITHITIVIDFFPLQISHDHDNSFNRLDTLHINDDTMGLPDFSLPVSILGVNILK